MSATALEARHNESVISRSFLMTWIITQKNVSFGNGKMFGWEKFFSLSAD